MGSSTSATTPFVPFSIDEKTPVAMLSVAIMRSPFSNFAITFSPEPGRLIYRMLHPLRRLIPAVDGGKSGDQHVADWRCLEDQTVSVGEGADWTPTRVSISERRNHHAR